MNSNDNLLKLKYSLQALAQPANIQLKLFPDFVQVADELALDFENWHSVVSQGSFDLTSSQKDSLVHLDTFLDNMSNGILKEELWTENALGNRREWEEVRSLAKEILKEFNWELGEPPFDRNQYVRSSTGKYRPAEATVISCESRDSLVHTIVDLEPFDDKNALSSYPRGPASLILRDEGKTIWDFDLHKALSVEEKKISFVSYIASSDLPVVGHRYVFQRWWIPDQLKAAQSNAFDWERKKFIPPHPKWDHEHCIICWKRFSEHEDEQHFGYVRINDRNQEDWICEKCYNEYVVSGFGKKLGDDIG